MENFILIVDDNLENLKVLSSILKEYGYKLALAQSGKEALLILEALKPMIILLDVMMPEMDGYETCRNIKKNEQWMDIPVIFITAKNDSQDFVEGYNNGGVDFITKPFNAVELLVRVKMHIEIVNNREIIREQELKLLELEKLVGEIKQKERL